MLQTHPHDSRLILMYQKLKAPRKIVHRSLRDVSQPLNLAVTSVAFRTLKSPQNTIVGQRLYFKNRLPITTVLNL